MVCPGFVALFVRFLPESPRWLIGQERFEKAGAIIVKHHVNGDDVRPIVELEMSEMTGSMRDGGLMTWKSKFNIRNLFNSRSCRYRLALCIVFSWFGQFSGNIIASYYLKLLVENVGITDTNTQLLLNAIYAIAGWVFAGSGARFHGVWGRRNMLMDSTFGIAICLAIVAGTAAGYLHDPSKKNQCPSPLYPSSTSLAASSLSPSPPCNPSTPAKCLIISREPKKWVSTFVAPIALKNIGYWFYVFFVFWDLFEFVVI